MGNTFGRALRITTWGESHGGGVGVVVDGCPPRLPITLEEIQLELNRRRPGQSDLTTPRQEEDQVQILSGLFEGQTLGTPISLMVWNKDARPEAYAPFKDTFRPSHADYTYEAKYGIRNWMGGGRASARETIGRVAAGALARKWLFLHYGVEIVAWVERVHDLRASVDADTVTREQVESNLVRCPDAHMAEKMAERIRWAKDQGDSVGGVVAVVARQVPAGLGEPVFDKLEAELAKGLMSLPAVKGVEIGSGFEGTLLTGSQHNDPFEMRDGQVRTLKNHSGGVQGGISNGENIVLRVAFKPTSTIFKAQQTVDKQGHEVVLEAQGRHDPCVLPRAVPIVEAMVALVLMDHALRQRAIAKE
ncbi:MAG: chorismate synthase [Candidatus Eremiobacteraeota bacterium]|nr:chorismate synthase [Candidatus Eremiobacteraeota bacterium]MCW5866685.1 chorismate synthase [Candidatus Eremiobacteraeota bacterium]